MKARIVFMGSPEFSLFTLKALVEDYSVVGVVTQPDRQSGRGRRLKSPPVKNLAQELGLPIIQPQKLSDPKAVEQFRDWNPDLIVVVAYGQILKPEVLDLPPHGCVNVHASLLPRWRGAAPIQAAILHGDQETGITIMNMDIGMDTGPIISQRIIPIHPTDNGGTLSDRLSILGAELLMDTLTPFLEGEITPISQDNALATYAPMLKKKNGQLDFTLPAKYLARQVRAFYPWPGSFTFWHEQVLKIHLTHVHPPDEILDFSISPGARTIFQSLPAFGTSEGLLVLDRVQPAGKKTMSGKAFLQGARGWAD
ncbi:methionyl-tRNA formyltransferase [Chloroflexota bacterium]